MISLNTKVNSNKKKIKPMSEINVTPFVDVMLVLLIIFMITAPLLKTGVDIELPKADTPNIPEYDDPLVISIDKNKEIFLSEKKINSDNLKPKLLEIKRANPDIKVFLRADKVVSYQTLMEVMKQIIESNISNVSLITSPED
ncbi:MAG: biopolymer transporter ExbD [Pseudomonadota bacterium]|nr:biopolymer transporter ExbD [Pseudomonadota bacterium]